MKTDAIANELSLNGFAHVRDLSKGLNISSTEKDALSFWWRNLVIDENFRQYTSRERRILRYQVSSRTPDRLKINLNPNYSSRVNYDAPYQRGVNVLAYAEEGFIHDSTLNRVLKFDLAVTLAAIKSVCCLDVDIHQFRVNARFGRPSPTTSGIHQDGYDFVFMHFIRSYNTRPVTSEIFSTPNKGRRQKLSATPDLSGTVLPLCLIPNSALKSAPPYKSVVPKASACVGLPA